MVSAGSVVTTTTASLPSYTAPLPMANAVAETKINAAKKQVGSVIVVVLSVMVMSIVAFTVR